MLNTHLFGIIDAAGNAFTIRGTTTSSEDRDPRFILPREVVDRANVVYLIDDHILIKCRWAKTDSEDALKIFQGIFRALSATTQELKAEYANTNYGSRTHHQQV